MQRHPPHDELSPTPWHRGSCGVAIVRNVLLCCGALLSGVGVFGGGVFGGVPRASASQIGTTALSGTALHEGVYVAPADPAGIVAFDAATATRSTIASDYLPTNRGWSGMDGSDNSLAWMFNEGWTGSGYTLSLGVPIVPTDASGHPIATLSAGATGAYNSHYVTLAETLVSAGEGTAYLRLGWEFDGGWFPWSATTPATEANFAAYFRQIVTAMRSVPGAHFRFVWNPDAGAFTKSGYDVALAYPGDHFVNDIGLDAYDESWVTPLTPANAWSRTTYPALTAAHRFAESKDRPLAVPEWGVTIMGNGHGLGDDPLYVRRLIAWMRSPANDVAYETYFDENDVEQRVNSEITDGHFPKSLRALRELTSPGHRASAQTAAKSSREPR